MLTGGRPCRAGRLGKGGGDDRRRVPDTRSMSILVLRLRLLFAVAIDIAVAICIGTEIEIETEIGSSIVADAVGLLSVLTAASFPHDCLVARLKHVSVCAACVPRRNFLVYALPVMDIFSPCRILCLTTAFA